MTCLRFKGKPLINLLNNNDWSSEYFNVTNSLIYDNIPYNLVFNICGQSIAQSAIPVDTLLGNICNGKENIAAALINYESNRCKVLALANDTVEYKMNCKRKITINEKICISWRDR
jgi:hypothetical protein